MEIYFKDKEGKLQETTLFNLLKQTFHKAGFKLENGSFSDEDHAWLGIVQENKKQQITTNITFKNNQNTITGLHIYVTPIKTILDTDNQTKLI